MTYEGKESMHLNTSLTFSRKAVRIRQQTGQKGTPGNTQPRWTIETITPPTSSSETSGFRCSLINQIGLAPAKQPQLTNEPGEAPPLSNTNLEDVSFIRKSTLAAAIRTLRIKGTANNHTLTYAIPADEAGNKGKTDPLPHGQTHDTTRDQQGDLNTEHEEIRKRIHATHSEQETKRKKVSRGHQSS